MHAPSFIQGKPCNGHICVKYSMTLNAES